MPHRGYQGGELEVFANAHRWKRYYARRLRRYIAGDVLEVGAGIGGTTRILCSGRERSWLCLEPDPELARDLAVNVARLPGPTTPKVLSGTIDNLAATPTFDCILYVDVLEHVENDRDELVRAGERLRPGGHLVVVAPAHDWLFSVFDRQVGHYRRYDRTSLRAVCPPALELRDTFYLDSVGTLLSLANRFLLRERLPTPRQVRIWDRFVVPCSRILDPLLAYRLGKTVIAAYRLPAQTR